MNKVCYNGNILSIHDFSIDPGNRSLLYGDGFFETIKWKNNALLYADDHWVRLSGSCEYLNLLNPFPSFEQWMDEINRLMDGATGNVYRLNIRLWRKPGGLYTPGSHEADYLITASEYDEDTVAGTVILEYYTAELKTAGRLSTLKSASALIYVMASLEKKKRQVDDLVIFNHHHRPVETTNANLFVVKDDQVYTPPLSEGCLDGVMRRNIIRFCRNEGIALSELPVATTLLESADEVFITNVMQGIRTVNRIGDVVYRNENTAGFIRSKKI